MNGFLQEFPADVKGCSSAIVDAAVEIYARMKTDLLPTPAKSHYVFNLRDLSKCVQGIWSDHPFFKDVSTIFNVLYLLYTCIVNNYKIYVSGKDDWFMYVFID